MWRAERWGCSAAALRAAAKLPKNGPHSACEKEKGKESFIQFASCSLATPVPTHESLKRPCLVLGLCMWFIVSWATLGLVYQVTSTNFFGSWHIVLLSPLSSEQGDLHFSGFFKNHNIYSPLPIAKMFQASEGRWQVQRAQLQRQRSAAGAWLCKWLAPHIFSQRTGNRRQVLKVHPHCNI